MLQALELSIVVILLARTCVHKPSAQYFGHDRRELLHVICTPTRIQSFCHSSNLFHELVHNIQCRHIEVLTCETTIQHLAINISIQVEYEKVPLESIGDIILAWDNIASPLSLKVTPLSFIKEVEIVFTSGA